MTGTKNNLTRYILIALVAGILLGWILNKNYVQGENATIAETTAALTALPTIKRDSTNLLYNSYVAQKQRLHEQRDAATAKRSDKLEPFSILADIFLRLIKMIVAPLVFTTLVVGVAKLGDIKTVGRIGGKSMLWFFSLSFISLGLGMLLVNLLNPGGAMHMSLPASVEITVSEGSLSLRQFLYHMFPTSAIDAMAKNEILQIVVFSLFFGVAAAAIGDAGKPVVNALDAISHIILKVTSYIMWVAPLAVLGAMVTVIAEQGIGILQTYSIFIGEVYLGFLILFALQLLGGYFFIKKRILKLLSYIKDPLLIAFSTTSSEAAFPKTMVELGRFGCSEKIVSFVLPLGYSFNLAGTMMYMTFGSIFIAQSYGIHLDAGTQLTMLLMLMFTSKGVAGVPRIALVAIAATLATFKIPEAGLALLFGIDPIIDMGRAALNVYGNGVATVVISKWENELSD